VPVYSLALPDLSSRVLIPVPLSSLRISAPPSVQGVQHDTGLVGQLGEERHHLAEPAAAPPSVPHVGSSSFLPCSMATEPEAAPPVPHAGSSSFLLCPVAAEAPRPWRQLLSRLALATDPWAL
jgi:hypothetical protein